MTDIPQRLINEIQNYTGFPWWNGKAYADFKGYPGRIRMLEGGIGDAVDDIHDVMNWLREDKLFRQSDRLRTIAGRLARLQGPYVPGKPPVLIRDIARGWK